jgi:hypothetical protein
MLKNAQIITILISLFGSMKSTWGETRYFIAQKTSLKPQDNGSNIFFKKVEIHYQKPCWAKYVDVVDKVIWDLSPNEKPTRNYRLGLGVLLSGDPVNSTCLGTSDEKKYFEFNTYKMLEADFKGFEILYTEGSDSFHSAQEKPSFDEIEPGSGKKD